MAGYSDESSYSCELTIGLVIFVLEFLSDARIYAWATRMGKAPSPLAHLACQACAGNPEFDIQRYSVLGYSVLDGAFGRTSR